MCFTGERLEKEVEDSLPSKYMLTFNCKEVTRYYRDSVLSVKVLKLSTFVEPVFFGLPVV